MNWKFVHLVQTNPPAGDYALWKNKLFSTGVPKLDFETVSLYSLIVYAKDNQGATASQTILIQIADVNEPPIFTGSLAQKNQDHGTVVTATRLDIERARFARVQSFSIKACDRDQRCAAVAVTAHIRGINDNSPFCDQYLIRNESYKMLTAFYKVGRVTAIDEDYPPNCVTYKITKGDIQVIQRFWIHPFSGMIELTTQPDYESVKQYNLTVEAVDCDKFHPRTAMTTVTVDIEEENDEAPVCTPSLHKAVIFDNIAAGTNVNGFKLNCHDRDSQDYEMRFEIVSGNENHHFGFDPTRGSDTPKLIVKNPFHFESGAELQRQYHLVVHIIDDNLKHGKPTKPRTGTTIIDIYVKRANMPPPPTTSSEVKSYSI
ncbi:Cadherin-related family member 3 [Tupaia chinensis]|uniref:Cadherin-related family member 3 n=1 Tax=Tupaia chinensis TaxID=246437 RepID=L9JE95_TUPCH|nr:Cadherin-related family member 3 [Tupaia chinensis]